MNDLLRVDNLRVSFRSRGGTLQVIRGFEAVISEGEITGVLGESGSGKTVSLTALLRLIDEDSGIIDSGSVLFRGTDLLRMPEPELRKIRGRDISYVFQNPAAALNPYRSIGEQMRGIARVHGAALPTELILRTLREVGIDRAELVADMYPWQLSGGLNQRAMIALALVLQPSIVIADEPTSFVDASLRSVILDLFADINRRHGTSIVIVTHDFDVIRYACHRLIVMYGGLVVEEGTVEAVMANPLHPYTRELINCTESLNSNQAELYSLPGAPLGPAEFRDECPFVHRCRLARPICSHGIPAMTTREGRSARCVLVRDGEADA